MSYFKPASVAGGGMLLAVVLASVVVAQEPTSRRQAFREIYQELVEINTTNSVGDSLRAAEAMAARLNAGGLTPDNVQVLSSAPRKGNLVARLGRAHVSAFPTGKPREAARKLLKLQTGAVARPAQQRRLHCNPHPRCFRHGRVRHALI